MYRRSLQILAQQTTRRTVVRDPRKRTKLPSTASREVVPSKNSQAPVQQQQQQRPPLPFEPTHQQQESIGSSMASYALAGVGVTLGVVLVRVILGF